MIDTHFRDRLRALINDVSAENGSNTPDMILAQFLVDVLAGFDTAVRSRDDWYNAGEGIDRDPRRGRPDLLPQRLSCIEAEIRRLHQKVAKLDRSYDRHLQARDPHTPGLGAGEAS